MAPLAAGGNDDHLEEQQLHREENTDVIVPSSGSTSAAASAEPFTHTQPRRLGENLQVREMARDGNCLFRSIAHQVYGSPEHHGLCRNRCLDYIASERTYFEQFVTEPWEEYMARMRKEGEWGDDVELEAVSEIYDCRIEIYGYGNMIMRTFHETCDAKWPRPIRLQYEGQCHYNSVEGSEGHSPIIGRDRRPGEVEDRAIAASKRRRERGAGRGNADMEQTERELLDTQIMDESIRLSRLEFAHQTDEEMSRALQASREDWEEREKETTEEGVFEAVMRESREEEEEKQLSMALQESKASGPAQLEEDLYSDQYPESVYAVMSMGFPLENCIQAYHLVGDKAEDILAFCCQNLSRGTL